MNDPQSPGDVPMVVRVEAAPIVSPAVPTPRVQRPRPGLFDGFLLTIGFAVALFGTMIGLVLAAVGWVWWREGLDQVTPGTDTARGLSSLHQFVQTMLAVAIPTAYGMGLIYALVVARVMVGPRWAEEAGLGRLPLAHMLLGVLALPGFAIVSDTIGGWLFRLFQMEQLQDQSHDLADLFRPFHWSFAVLSIGIGPGVVEELWCRGFLGRGFVGRYGWVGGVALTSLFFGALHLYPPPYVLVTGLTGVGLHYTYAMSRSLWVPMVIHILNNSFATLVAIQLIPTTRMEQAMSDQPILTVSLALALLGLAGLAMWTGRARFETPPASPLSQQGVMVPNGAEWAIREGRANPILVIGTAVCSGAMLWLLFV